jgi:hypothetical protein
MSGRNSEESGISGTGRHRSPSARSGQAFASLRMTNVGGRWRYERGITNLPGSVAVAVAALGEELDHQHADHKTTDVGPEGNAAGGTACVG